MSNLPKQLRKLAPFLSCWEDGETGLPSRDDELLLVAAKEIEALHQRAERAEAERDRLREAHEENARILGYLENEMQGRVEAGKVGALSKCAERSRSALRQDKGGE